MRNVLLAEPALISLVALAIFAFLLVASLAVAVIVAVTVFVRNLKKNPEPPQSPHAAKPPLTEPIQELPARKCPKCGADLKSDLPEGLCPACLLQHGLATEGGAPPGSSPFTPPTLSELAKLFPQLEVLEIIGQGGMGAVYKARQPTLDRFVALKILAPRAGGDLDFSGRFSREARALARLSHPNIVGVYDFGQIQRSNTEASAAATEPQPLSYFIMEYVDGPNLRQLEQSGKLAPREALQIIPQICAALQFAHDEGIVHRDIKPENVLLDKKGRVKIADFGLAKILGQNADFRLTGARDVMGTPHYMAPEQVEKPQEVDHRADIYSLGVVFYEMLTGELPLGKFDPPSHKVQIDVRLDDVVLRSLANNPDRRYQHASEIKTELDSIAETPSQAASNRIARANQGVDYRSNRTLFGLPLVHIASGVDPETGKARVAKGIIAIGGRAQGVLAIGGRAQGVLAIGGLSAGVVAIGGGAVGVFAVGGCALGLFSFGGLAIALLLAVGGGAIGPIALGGGVFGYMAFGGGGLGTHVFAGNARDPIAQQFFHNWGSVLLANAQFLIALVIILAVGIGVGALIWVRRHSKSPNNLRLQQISIAALLLLALLVAAAWILWPMQARFNLQSSDSARANLEATNAIRAIVHIRRFTAYSPNSPDIEYAAISPSGYALEATASPGGSVHLVPMPGSDENRVFWNFPFIKPIRPLKPGDFKPGQPLPTLPPQKFDSAQERETQRKVLASQVQELQDQGPIPIVRGQPKLLFSITNGSGDVWQGFLELVRSETNASAIQADPTTGQPAAAINPQSLSPEERAILIEAQRDKLRGSPGPILPPAEFSGGVGGVQKSRPPIASSAIDAHLGLPSSGLAEQQDQAGTLLFAQQPPVVVETFPISGARNVPSGELEIHVRFSKLMEDGSWSWSTAWENSTPESIGPTRYLSDGRTCAMKVRLEPGRTYAWWLNSDKFHNFKDTAGIPSVPYLLNFQTRPN